VRLNLSFQVSLAAFMESVRKLGLEGIVAKRFDSLYIPGKESDAWRKHRFNQEDELVIGGYISGGQNFSELLIGEERGNDLVFIKRLIAGFVPHTRAEVFDAIKVR
jgi:bifunctional non-homologous end joining protein LigD